MAQSSGSQRPTSYTKRKEPKQKRSRFTVDSIKQATLELLEGVGDPGFGTEHIAEKAGVSIGSLYQYFPNKESILTAIYEDIAYEYAGVLNSEIPKLVDVPTEEAVASTVELLLDVYSRHRLVLVKLLHDYPQLNLARQPYSFSSLVHSSTRSYLLYRSESRQPAEIERKAFFLEKIILGCIDAWLREFEEQIDRDDFVRDLVRIISGYLDG